MKKGNGWKEFWWLSFVSVCQRRWWDHPFIWNYQHVIVQILEMEIFMHPLPWRFKEVSCCWYLDVFYFCLTCACDLLISLFISFPARATPQTLLHKLSPRFILHPDIHTHQSPTLLHSRCCSDCLAHYSKAGFKIFPPPVQICSTLKWISLLHLSSLLTGDVNHPDRPVWGLFNLSPWFRVFLEQEGRSKSLWASDVNQALGPHWLVSSAGEEARSNMAVGKKKKKRRNLIRVAPLGSDYLAVAAWWLHQPVSTLTHINLVWDEASHVLCTGTDKRDVCVFYCPLLCARTRLWGQR